MKRQTADERPSILRTRLVLSKIIRRQKFTETAEENKVEQAIVRYVLVMLEEFGRVICLAPLGPKIISFCAGVDKV